MGGRGWDLGSGREEKGLSVVDGGAVRLKVHAWRMREMVEGDRYAIGEIGGIERVDPLSNMDTLGIHPITVLRVPWDIISVLQTHVQYAASSRSTSRRDAPRSMRQTLTI